MKNIILVLTIVAAATGLGACGKRGDPTPLPNLTQNI
jgi:predicted small lipoprotein YifL